MGLKRCGPPVSSFSVRDSNRTDLIQVSKIHEHIVFWPWDWYGMSSLAVFQVFLQNLIWAKLPQPKCPYWPWDDFMFSGNMWLWHGICQSKSTFWGKPTFPFAFINDLFLFEGRCPVATGRYPVATGRYRCPVATGRCPVATGHWYLVIGTWSLGIGHWD